MYRLSDAESKDCVLRFFMSDRYDRIDELEEAIANVTRKMNGVYGDLTDTGISTVHTAGIVVSLKKRAA